MSMLTRLFLMALLAVAGLPTAAQQMNKCKQANGSYSFQDTPCPGSASQEVIKFDARGNIQKNPKASASQEAVSPSPAAKAIEPPPPSPVPGTTSTPATSTTPSPTPPPLPRIAPNIENEPIVTSTPTPRNNPYARTEKSASGWSGLGIVRIVFGLISIAGLFVSGIWLLVLAFQKSLLWGLLCLFVSFPCTLIFVATNWEQAKMPFLISVFSTGLLVFTIIGIF